MIMNEPQLPKIFLSFAINLHGANDCYRKKRKPGIMSDTIKGSCLVCDSQNNQLDLNVLDHFLTQKSFELYRCNDCGFKYINNPPPVEEASTYYATDDYVEHSDSKEGFVNYLYHFARKRMLRVKYQWLDQYDVERKILDFGTGTGYFLNFMKNKGFDTTGIEINPEAREYGKDNFNLEIYSPEELMLESFPSAYGLITFWHVLEHVYNVDEVIQRVRNLLLPNGKLVIALPNHRCIEANTYGAYWNGYDIPRHLWHWDPMSFKAYAERHGFSILETKVLPFDPFYNCLMSASFRKNILGYMMLPFVSFYSLLRGWFNHSKASSVVYILEKA